MITPPIYPVAVVTAPARQPARIASGPVLTRQAAAISVSRFPRPPRWPWSLAVDLPWNSTSTLLSRVWILAETYFRRSTPCEVITRVTKFLAGGKIMDGKPLRAVIISWWGTFQFSIWHRIIIARVVNVVFHCALLCKQMRCVHLPMVKIFMITRRYCESQLNDSHFSFTVNLPVQDLTSLSHVISPAITPCRYLLSFLVWHQHAFGSTLLPPHEKYLAVS